MIKIEITRDEFTPWLKKFKKQYQTMSSLTNEVGRYMVSSTQRKIKEGVPPPNVPLTRAYKKGSKLTLRDTGRLLSSITYKADSEKAVIGADVEYARIQQLGGVIKPKKARELYIPASWKTRQLMRKFGATPARCIEGMKRAGYQVYRPKGKKVIMARTGKRGKPFVLFILKRQVEIPARPFLGIDEKDKKVIKQKVLKWLGF